jgi:hypothetical protein
MCLLSTVVSPTIWQNAIAWSVLKVGSNVVVTVPCETTSHTCHDERIITVRRCVRDEVSNVSADCFEGESDQLTVFGGDCVAVALTTRALPVDSAMLLSCSERSAFAVSAREIATEDENLSHVCL